MNANTKNTFGIARRRVLLGMAATSLSACFSNAEPIAQAREVTDPDPLALFRIDTEAAPSEWAKHLQKPQGRSPVVLALSAGGEDGAFGAGALSGWSRTGDRPEFDLVTGISSGALIAPFAFMGSDYDDALKQIFTEHDAGDIMRLRPIQAISNGAIYDTEPLAELIEDYTPDAFIDQIAARHLAGARLLIVTSEVETARAFVWDMGAIAQARQYDLFRSVMRASAALPGMFSPVVLTYQSGGVTYQETHIDGGVHMQFLAFPSFAFMSEDGKPQGGEVYLIVNNTLNPEPTTVSGSALGIAQQALTTMGRASALAAVSAAQMFANENGIALSVTSIDPNAGIVYDPTERFSSAYMGSLFAHGLDRARDQTLWRTTSVASG